MAETQEDASLSELQKKHLLLEWLIGLGELPEGSAEQSLSDMLSNGRILCNLANRLVEGVTPSRFLRCRGNIRDIDRLSGFVRGMKQIVLLHQHVPQLLPPFSGRQLLDLFASTSSSERNALWDYLDELRLLWPQFSLHSMSRDVIHRSRKAAAPAESSPASPVMQIARTSTLPSLHRRPFRSPRVALANETSPLVGSSSSSLVRAQTSSPLAAAPATQPASPVVPSLHLAEVTRLQSKPPSIESPPAPPRIDREGSHRTLTRTRTTHLLRTFTAHLAKAMDAGSQATAGVGGDDDDDDWETDPDPVAQPTYRVPSSSQAPPTSETQSEKSEDEFEEVFGVRRGKCRHQANDGCVKYAKPDADRGGPCTTCGHYPIQHEPVSLNPMAQVDQCLIPFEALVFREKLGQGRFGCVYRGKWKAAGQVAIKVTRGDDTASDDEFKKEVWSLRLVRHPNILLLIGAAIHGGDRYLVTELCQRGNLRGFIQRAAVFDPFLFLDLLVGAAQGLNYLHELRLVHCDIKTDNILVRSPPAAVIGDLGSTCVEFSPNTGAGTFQYKAPELLLDDYFERPTTRASDVYSFAIVLYETFTWGLLAFPDEADQFEMQRRISAGERPEIPFSSPLSVIPGLVQLIEQGWSQNPEDRPKMHETASALLRMKAELVQTQPLLAPHVEAVNHGRHRSLSL